MCLSLLLTFSLKHEETGSGATHFSEEKLNLKGVERHLDRRSPMFCETCVVNFISEIHGIDKIIWGFLTKADRRKSPKIKLNLSMPKRTPKRRSPNTGKYQLKWAITVRRRQISIKCNKICESKLTASRNTSSSECAIFP